MKKTITYCDCCGNETSLESLNVGNERMDFCGSCAIRCLHLFLPANSFTHLIEYVGANLESLKGKNEAK